MRLSQVDRLGFLGAALLHDSLIPGLGHLVEEALNYVGTRLNHESYWESLLAHDEVNEVGGAELQIYLGKESGLRKWAQRHLAPNSDHRLKHLISAIRGQGPWGKCISGPLDVDNLDNVVRVAFHLGLQVDRKLPINIAAAAVAMDEDGFLFDDSAVAYIREWAELRATVYERLMPAFPDFSGKVMIVSAVIHAFREGIFQRSDWKQTDSELISRFVSCGIPSVADPIGRWLLGEYWATSNLTWMDGKFPESTSVAQFSDEVSKVLGRPCLAHHIKDKRHRSLALRTVSGSKVNIGSTSSLWLLGVASPTRRSFTSRDNTLILETAKDFFGCLPIQHTESSPGATLPLF
jgi:hypothetical protein